MNNDALKKKIVEIIINAIWKDAEADYDSTDETEACSIADALIAAGIGDVKEAEHRAKVAENALKDRATYCATYCVMEGMDCFSLTSVAIEARAKELYKGWRRKAEKELAEEKKDGNKTD